jgi:hypothetical protein
VVVVTTTIITTTTTTTPAAAATTTTTANYRQPQRISKIYPIEFQKEFQKIYDEIKCERQIGCQKICRKSVAWWGFEEGNLFRRHPYTQRFLYTKKEVFTHRCFVQRCFCAPK